MKLETAPVLGHASPTRCPYCHDDVQPQTEAWVVCSGCLARHHDACWEGVCASCAHDEALTPKRTERQRPPARHPLNPVAGQLSVRKALREASAFYRRPGFGLIFLASAITSLLTGASFLILGGLLTAGLWRVFLKHSRKEEPKLADLFAHSERFWPLTGAFVALSLFSLLGLGALGVGFVFTTALLTYTIPLMAEHGFRFGHALKESTRRAKAGGLRAHLTLGLLSLLFFLPEVALDGILPGLSAILAPLSFGMWASAYRQVVEADPKKTPDPKTKDAAPAPVVDAPRVED